MNTTIKATNYTLSPETEASVRERLEAVGKLLGEEGDAAQLEIELEEAPAEGRSANPHRLVARLIVGGNVYHAEAVKPSPESAADRVRNTLEAEVRHARGRTRRLMRRGSSALKKMLRFGS